jgi:hypothetical protein
MIYSPRKISNVACLSSVWAETVISNRLREIGVDATYPRNRLFQQVIPVEDFEKLIERPIDDFLSYIELDRQGVLEEIGWPAYTGMGGEIIPAFYRTMKNNPRPYLVSCYQKVYAYSRGTDLIFGVELPNVEVGITSSPEGIQCQRIRGRCSGNNPWGGI